VNALLEKGDCHSGNLSHLSDADITEIFSKTQDTRYKRAVQVVRGAHEQQALWAYEKPWLSNFILKFMLALTGNEFVFNKIGVTLKGSASLKRLAIPHRPRKIPFDDELPRKPVSQLTSRLVRAGFVSAMALTVVLASKAFRLPIPELGDWGTSGPLRRAWLGHPRLDEAFNKFLSIFSYPILGPDPAPRLQLVYLLSQLISPLLIYTTEGYRLGNQGTLLSLPSIFNVVMQLWGIGVIAPIHAAISALQSHEMPPGRFIQPEVARALIPALTLGYIVPTILALVPTSNTRVWQNWIALWQLAPLLFSVLTLGFSKALRPLKQQRQHPNRQPSETDAKSNEDPDVRESEAFDQYKSADVPILQSVYMYAFTVQATAHIATLVYSYSAGLPLSTTFFGLPNVFEKSWELGDISSQVAMFFKFDQVFATAAILASQLYSVWDLRRLGYIKTRDALKAAGGVILGQGLLGSGATWAGLWYWKEKIMSSLGQ
jgi:hypothetical protein